MDPRTVRRTLSAVDNGTASPAPSYAGQQDLQSAMARHPAGVAGYQPLPRSRDELLLEVLDTCTACEGNGAELCDACAEAILAAYRERRAQPR